MHECLVCGYVTESVNLYFDHLNFDEYHAQCSYQKNLRNKQRLSAKIFRKQQHYQHISTSPIQMSGNIPPKHY
ncbi:hypothetical protein AYI69_g5457 [Smittium culicis]|uniref:Uncharacterized protein n=1 Tax=Smittium culicis TaxID=133412 RepID=A0A1R1Y5Y3_9FUNG|nr:hypothetical protein AYI69_g5457 [Smittium culicis]